MFILSVLNLAIFSLNFLSETSDGKRCFYALKYRKTLVDFLDKRNYKFNDGIEEVSKKMMDKFQSK